MNGDIVFGLFAGSSPPLLVHIVRRLRAALAARREAQRSRPAGNAKCPNCARLEDELLFALDDLEAERARATALEAAAPPNTEQGRG